MVAISIAVLLVQTPLNGIVNYIVSSPAYVLYVKAHTQTGIKSQAMQFQLKTSYHFKLLLRQW